MPKPKRERRKPVICPYCQRVMVTTRRIEPISSLTKGYYVWYICPRRRKESGCGYASLIQISPKTKRLSRTIFSVRFKKLESKRTKK